MKWLALTAASTGLTTAALAFLNATGTIDWPWFWVLAPALVLAVAAGLGIALAFALIALDPEDLLNFECDDTAARPAHRRDRAQDRDSLQ